MAGRGSTWLRKLLPESKYGSIVPKTVQKPSLSQPHTDCAIGSRGWFGIHYRLLSSMPEIESHIFHKQKIQTKGGAKHNVETFIDRPSVKSRPYANNREVVKLPSEFADRSSRKARTIPESEAEENEVVQMSMKAKSRRATAEKSHIQSSCRRNFKDTEGELKRGTDNPSAYVSTDFVDHRAMQLVFLGTSSSIPTLSRSTSCIALRLDGSIFLFDCGEGAVRQILKTPMKHYDISKIFVTHMHGDHCFGTMPSTSGLFLPTSCILQPSLNVVQRYMDYQEGLLCRIGLKEFQSKNPIQIYGPQGLRQWIRSTLKASHARVHPKYVVNEIILKNKPPNMTHSWNFVEENHEDELVGKDIKCSQDCLWHVYEDDKYLVRASLLRHNIPCWGYVLEEHTRRGRFNLERAEEAGVKPGRYFRMLENGESVTLSSGKLVSPSDVLGPSRRGRKVVILGDTCDSTSMIAAAKEADVVVHEATVLDQDAAEVYQRGHSTARMAGEFAQAINAGTLVLTHFSRKLDGALFVDEKSHVQTTIVNIVSAAQQSFGKDSVIAAEDLMAITIRLEDRLPLQLSNY